MQLSKKVYIIIYLMLLVLPLAFVCIGSYFITSLNMLALKTYYIYYGGAVLSCISLLIVLVNNKFIKDNFKHDKKNINNQMILRCNLIFIIFYLIINIISLLLNYFNINQYFIYASYMFFPLVYFCVILFLDKQQLSNEDVHYILLSVYLFWYLLVPLVSFMLTSVSGTSQVDLSLIKSLLYNLMYKFISFALLVMPFMSMGLAKISHEKNTKSMVCKFSFPTKRLFIIALILTLIALSLSIALARV